MDSSIILLSDPPYSLTNNNHHIGFLKVLVLNLYDDGCLPHNVLLKPMDLA